MKRKFVKICSVLCAFVLLSGCAGGGTEKPVQGEPQTESTQNGSEVAEFSYPMAEGKTITWWKRLKPEVALHYTSINETPFMEGLEERTGVEIEFIHPPTGQEKEQFGLLLADGDFPDVIEYNWLTSYPGGPQKAIKDGVVLPLNDIIDKYCPNFKAYLQENPDVDKMIKTDSGQYYAFPMIRGEAETVLIGPVMRKDWLKELNLEIPTTVDEWYTVLNAFKDKKGAQAPYSYRYTNATLRNSNPILLAYVISPDFYVGSNGEVQYGSIEENYKKYLETFSQWYQEGLVDVDLASLKKEQVSAKVTSGQTGASVGYTESDMGAWIVAGRKENPDYSVTAVPWPTLEKGQRPQSGQCENMYSGEDGVAITTSCEDVERVARNIDYAFSQEGHIYANFGEEGISYTMVDGQPKFTDLILKNPDGLSNDSARGVYAMSSGAVVRDPRVPKQTLDLPEKLEARYEIWPDTDARKYRLPPISPSSEESKEFATIMNQIEIYRDEMTIKYIMGQESPDTFDQYVETIKKLGIDRALEIQNAALKRYNER